MPGRPVKQQPFIFAEVLQNGAPLASVKKSLRRGTVLSITNRYTGDLGLPLYPLNGDIRFLRVKSGNAAELTLDRNWEGYFTSKGQITVLDRENSRPESMVIYSGDYVSVGHDDLQLLIRIGPEIQHEITTKQSPQYKGSLISLLFDGKQDAIPFGLALLMTITIAIGPILGLATRPDDRPKRFEDLSHEYIYPFIAPEHFALAPEALQGHLNRRDLVSSTVKFYRNLISVLVGQPPPAPELILSSSLSTQSRQWKELEADIEAAVMRQQTANETLQRVNGTSLLTIPSVIGESYQGRLMRLFDKLEIFHSGLIRNLDSRREFTEGFSKDQPYDYDRYRDVPAINVKAAKQLGSINPWQTLSDEAAMYQEASVLAGKAARASESIRKARSDTTILLPQHVNPVLLSPDLPFTSSSASFLEFPYKTSKLQGIEFKPGKKVTAKEPIVGAVDPKLILATIEKRRFELKLCYELALRKDKKTQGSVDLRWTVDTYGKADDVEIIKTQIHDQDFLQCLQKKLLRWVFPLPKRGSVEIVHGFDFHPEKANF